MEIHSCGVNVSGSGAELEKFEMHDGICDIRHEGVMTYCYTREENPDIVKMLQLLWNLMNNGVMKNFKWNVATEE